VINRSSTNTRQPNASGQGTLENAIRNLRRELGLTQVQFAAELGITPTSVYRYEVGSSVPTSDILVKILQRAVDRQLPTLVQDLTDAIAKRTGLNLFEGEHLSSETPFIRALSTLRLEKQMLVMAVVSMLLESEDSTDTRVLEALLVPWIPKAKEMFGGPDLPLRAPADPNKAHSNDRKIHTKKPGK
jgi:transcriptional regulator with XRE-family HTH domain